MKRAQAKTLGLKRYTTGRPCPQGHPVERFVSTGSCVECLRVQNAAWREANPEKVRVAQKKANDARFSADPDSVRTRKRLSARRNADAVKARFVRWYAKNSQRVIDSAKAWTKDNPELAKALGKKRSATRRAKIASVGGSYELSDIQRMYMEQGGNCTYCKVFLADKFEIDHRLPIALGGSNFPKNLQLLCRTCNRQKAAKHPDLFELEFKARA